MSKLSEYIDSAVGYDTNGLPASTIQFTFGSTPFSIAENENVEDLTEITTVCQSDAVIEMKFLDDILLLSFDFSTEIQTLVEMYQDVQDYIALKDHVTETLNKYMADLSVAERNADEATMQEISTKIRCMSIPFFLPTILPVIYDGTVHICFSDDPKFIMFTSDELNHTPYKLTMIFDASSLFVQDEVAIYEYDAEDEIQEQQEELWYMEEAKKAEEEAYQSQYGYNAGLYEQEDEVVDSRLKGVRITKN